MLIIVRYPRSTFPLSQSLQQLITALETFLCGHHGLLVPSLGALATIRSLPRTTLLQRQFLNGTFRIQMYDLCFCVPERRDTDSEIPNSTTCFAKAYL